jgi:hypothetical protein
VLIENQRWPSLQDKILAKNNTVWESSWIEMTFFQFQFNNLRFL